ncbi:MAG: YjbQ family protein [Spirochaetaceae bacterium]|nr:YjbQ family protein [Spirochaetaceae bacterium]
MRQFITLRTLEREALYDITKAVKSALTASGIRNGICSLYVQGATAALMIQENWDDSVPRDVLKMMSNIDPREQRTVVVTVLGDEGYENE